MSTPEHRQWYSLIEGNDPDPPIDTIVEVKGHRGDDVVEQSWYGSSIGDWMGISGDPTHWRPLDDK